MTGTSRRLVVGAIVVDSLEAPTAVLAARRTSPASLAGLWEFPGGKVEPAESPEEALHRELREELSVEVRLGDELLGPDGGCWPISGSLVMRVWFAVVVRGTVWASGPHDQTRWLRPECLDDVPWLPADEAVVARLGAVWLEPPRRAGRGL